MVSVSHMTWKWEFKIRREWIDKKVIEAEKTAIQNVATTLTHNRVWSLELSNKNGVQCLNERGIYFSKGIRNGKSNSTITESAAS